ncbi:hypothetical protein SBADM41S_01329 [Streptomyces badius]
MYPVGRGREIRKSRGNMSSPSPGSTKTLAKGVAVYPTYWARGRSPSNWEIWPLIAVRVTLPSSHFFGSVVLTDAGPTRRR